MEDKLVDLSKNPFSYDKRLENTVNIIHISDAHNN
jgi:hypothetical protein